MKLNLRYLVAELISACVLMVISCTSCSDKTKSADDATASLPEFRDDVKFNSDTAFKYVRRQVTFGSRVPGSEGHKKCEDYIIKKLHTAGAKVTEQKSTVEAYTGVTLPINNILGQFNPEDSTRILLVAHYDTRPWADNDSNPENANKPVPGANDGGSGVAVMLEIARQLSENNPGYGVDLLFVDAEDYGDSSRFGNNEKTWCLGSQYWVANMPYTDANKPRFCVVIDMVGGINAKFYREYYSDKYAKDVVDKVWSTAQKSGYADRFINKGGGGVNDDHIYINHGGIPAIDIIESNNDITHTFPPTWHTNNDNLSNIDKASLKAVGQTILNLIFNEK